MQLASNGIGNFKQIATGGRHLCAPKRLAPLAALVVVVVGVVVDVASPSSSWQAKPLICTCNVIIGFERQACSLARPAVLSHLPRADVSKSPADCDIGKPACQPASRPAMRASGHTKSELLQKRAQLKLVGQHKWHLAVILQASRKEDIARLGAICQAQIASHDYAKSRRKPPESNEMQLLTGR